MSSIPWDKILEYAKLLGPYLFEIIKVLLSGPHSQAVENLREKGLLKDNK